jgi:hypothetical protein
MCKVVEESLEVNARLDCWGRRVAPNQVIARHLDFARPANKYHSTHPAHMSTLFDSS